MPKCIQCNKLFEEGLAFNKFCSRACQRSYYSNQYYHKNEKERNKQRVRNRKRYYSIIIKNPILINKLRQNMRGWYLKNKEKHIKKVMEYSKKNYYKYKEKYKIRQYTSKKFRLEMIKQYKSCQKCGSKKNLELHHIHYSRKREDLMLLCRVCHNKEHLMYKSF